jgi:UDP-N-acetylglucosamine--N-acetylmuramyl-(pentapeptide) pyrophosphoryl-undecaprenol N-acetylglucosamine transferase
MMKCCKNLAASGIQIIWQTGDSDFEKISGTIKNNNVKVYKYIDNIDYAYSACDLVLCRAGISTVMELAAFGLAAVFAPFPGASENHQEKNARALAEKNAAEIIYDNEMDAKLESVILNLINDNSRLNTMSENIKQFADRKSASKIAQMLVEMVNSSKN